MDKGEFSINNQPQVEPSTINAVYTPRLILLPLNREVITRRLETSNFTLEITPALTVYFGPQWPGDALAAFPFLLTQVHGGPQAGIVPGSFVAVERTSGQAVGLLGTKGKIDAAFTQEIGYGFIPSSWGQGYATEAVEALVKHLFATTSVQIVTAQTALSNRASERVLEKVGFERTGLGWNKEDGDLTNWELSKL